MWVLWLIRAVWQFKIHPWGQWSFWARHHCVSSPVITPVLVLMSAACRSFRDLMLGGQPSFVVLVLKYFLLFLFFEFWDFLFLTTYFSFYTYLFNVNYCFIYLFVWFVTSSYSLSQFSIYTIYIDKFHNVSMPSTDHMCLECEPQQCL